MSKNGMEVEKINGLLDKGCSMEGKLTFDGGVQINGDFKGEIESDGTLVIGPEASVCGNIHVGELIVEGRIEGKVNASTKIELRHGSRAISDIKCPTLVIEEGAKYQGQCLMLEDVNTAGTKTTEENIMDKGAECVVDHMSENRDVEAEKDEDSLIQ